MNLVAAREIPQHLQNVKVPWGPLGEQIFRRTYSHVQNPDEVWNSRSSDRPIKPIYETWPETVVRVVNGNLALVPEKFLESSEREQLIELLLQFGALPAGRHLNASGVKGRQFLFNCHASGWDGQHPGDHFSFLFDELMQGGGVGSNYSNRYMDELPKVANAISLHVICSQEHPDHNEFAHLLSNEPHEEGFKLSVPDSREGWTESIELIFKTAFTNYKELREQAGLEETDPLPIVIDVSSIRRKGAPLKTSGGIACGPGPLVSAMTDVVRHLNGCVGRKMTSLDGMTLDHHLASCVVAGGKRRSSRMSVKNWKDKDIHEFINCKREDGAHWTTNISVEIDDEFLMAYEAGKEEATSLMKLIVMGKRSNGEPGIWNRSLAMKDERDPEQMFCPNPCGEIGLQMWENCNLGHVNMQYFAFRPLDEMYEAYRLMSRWLVRATFGDIPSARQREVVDRNRRIGVGFFGFHGWLALNNIRYSDCWNNPMVLDVLGKCKKTVQDEAKTYATLLGIPVPIKNTTLAPTGTTAMLAGVTSSGQAMMAPWYKRLVRYFSEDPELALKKEEGYETWKDQDAANTEYVVYWCEDPLASKLNTMGIDPEKILESQYEVSFGTSLKVQAMLQDVYADNAISYTINLKVDQVSEEEMEAQLFDVLPHLKGTTFFPEKSRKNAPIQPITKAAFDSYQGRKEISMVEEECRGGCPIK